MLYNISYGSRLFRTSISLSTVHEQLTNLIITLF